MGTGFTIYAGSREKIVANWMGLAVGNGQEMPTKHLHSLTQFGFRGCKPGCHRGG